MKTLPALRYNVPIIISSFGRRRRGAKPKRARRRSRCRRIPLPWTHAARNGGAAESRADPRLIPPRSTARIVARERLLAQLLDARRNRCVVLQGPAGCGKTSLLIAWREALLPLGFDIAWLTLAPEDNELTHFLDYLVASLAQVDPAMCREATLLGGRGMDDEAVERTIIALVRGIAAHSNDVVLVLDDLHHLTNARNHEALQWLLDYAPPNLHLVLVSRGTVPLSLGRLRDQGLVLELDMRDLRFTAAESEAFLKSQLGEISQRDARHLHELTDGWVAGLQLFAMRLKAQEAGARRTSRRPTRSRTPNFSTPEAFAAYFEREVLSRLAPSEVELLIRMASCTRVCAPLCVALIGDEQSPAEVRALLTRLESDNLFIAPIESSGSETWYRLNPLFRETLLERFRARSEPHQREVHLAAWLWFRDHDQPDEAVRHALLAGESVGGGRPRAARRAHDADQGRAAQAGRADASCCRSPKCRRASGCGCGWCICNCMRANSMPAPPAIARLQADIPQDDTHSRYRLILLAGGACRAARRHRRRDGRVAAAAAHPRARRQPGRRRPQQPAVVALHAPRRIRSGARASRAKRRRFWSTACRSWAPRRAC